jgi:hypothetical protein
MICSALANIRSSPGAVSLACLLVSTVTIPAALLWDYSWECTEGIDLFWSAPHVALYAAVLVGALGACLAFWPNEGIALGRIRAPLGVWLALWGALAFVTATLFDRWWQTSYGLGAGVWHPPQILKAIAFITIVTGAWLCCLGRPILFTLTGGMLLGLTSVMTIIFCYANRQHGAGFYQLSCAVYPITLVALTVAGPRKFSATLGALAALILELLAIWLLPLVPGSPQVAPIYNPRDHLMPPPFPLLLIGPALVIDLLLRFFPGREQRFQNERRAVECGLAFFVIFIIVQWNVSRFLLTPDADNWFFAGGGRHWPFFLKLDVTTRIIFWKLPGDEMTLSAGILSAGLAIVSARAGLGIGNWMLRIKR